MSQYPIKFLKGGLCAALLMIWIGCERVRTPDARDDLKPHPKESLQTAPQGELLDGFEGQTVWAFDAADDEGLAVYNSRNKTEGEQALEITLKGKGKRGKLHLRREVDLDLRQAQGISLDIYSPLDGTSVALALKSQPDEIYQESRPVKLKTGWNRAVWFPLSAPHWKNSQTNWAFTAGPINLDRVMRLMILLFPEQAEEGAFVLDNLRLHGDTRSAQRSWRPELLFQSPIEHAMQYQPNESVVVFRASYREPFDPSEISLGFSVVTPSGKTLEVPGFFSGLGKGALSGISQGASSPPLFGPFVQGSAENDSKPSSMDKVGSTSQPLLEAPDPGLVPLWRIRYTPRESGRHRLKLWIRNRAGSYLGPEQELVVQTQDRTKAYPGQHGGMIRVSRSDPRQFETDAGDPFFLLGSNVCWTQDYPHYLNKIASYGGNVCRIWLCPWGLKLERTTEPGVFDLATARQIDALMLDAERLGVRIIFCFHFHGATTDFWREYPYARENGGPCALPRDFFLEPSARRLFQRLLHYAIGRWGASPALLCWELLNEIDLAGFDRVDAAVAWTREMAAYLKHHDPYRHLVTISTSNFEFAPEIWTIPEIDFISLHVYGKHVQNALAASLGQYLHLGKPVLIGEFGGGVQPEVDAADKEGVRLQAALWLTACAPTAGVALPWWWDTQIETHDLYGHFHAVGAFLKHEDRRGRLQSWVRRELPKNRGVFVEGIMDAQSARFYIHHPDSTEEAVQPTNMQALDDQLPLRGMLGGSYKIEFWDVQNGKIQGETSVEVTDSSLYLDLPAQSRPYAVKIERKQRAVPNLGP